MGERTTSASLCSCRVEQDRPCGHGRGGEEASPSQLSVLTADADIDRYAKDPTAPHQPPHHHHHPEKRPHVTAAVTLDPFGDDNFVMPTGLKKHTNTMPSANKRLLEGGGEEDGSPPPPPPPPPSEAGLGSPRPSPTDSLARTARGVIPQKIPQHHHTYGGSSRFGRGRGGGGGVAELPKSPQELMRHRRWAGQANTHGVGVGAGLGVPGHPHHPHTQQQQHSYGMVSRRAGGGEQQRRGVGVGVLSDDEREQEDLVQTVQGLNAMWRSVLESHAKKGQQHHLLNPITRTSPPRRHTATSG